MLLQRRWPACVALAIIVSLALVSCSGSGGGDDGGSTTGPGDVTPPSVVSVSPAAGAADVDVGTTLVVTFSEAIDASSVGANTIQLALGAAKDAPVAGTPAVDNDHLVFSPDADLAPSVTYLAEIGVDVTDIAGNHLADAYAWTFMTAAPPQAPLDVPLAQGNAWLYHGESSASVWSQYGYSSSSSEELRVLFVEGPVSHADRDGWLVRSYTLDQTVTTEIALRSEFFYLCGDADGLYRAEPDDGAWLNVILFTYPTFDDSAFLLADGPAHSDGTTLSASSIQVPAGAFETLRIEHAYSSTGPYAPEDIFETRREHYADGVGLVHASWDYSFDDSDPSGIDITAQGYAELLDVPGGPALPYLAAEQEPNDDHGPTAAQSLGPFAVVSGTVHHDDPGAVIDDADVYCQLAECVLPDVNGVAKLEDWYLVDVAQAGQYRLDLVFELYDSAHQVWNDLDLYVFQDLGDGTVAYAIRADDEAGNPEWVVFTWMPAGRYYVAVQAWDTPAGAVPYALSMSEQAVPVKLGRAAGARGSASSGK
ncbi:Ig-like domain-containing protein [bacterium]|nr:Ig-like domain-containing protein [bacterium]MBU1676423.1 Ig-like domain-containing protein [bacterium]